MRGFFKILVLFVFATCLVVMPVFGRGQSAPKSSAASGGEAQRALALAESGTPVNVRTPSGNTLLHEAVQFHHHTVVRYLVDNGSDIHAVDTHDSVPVLMGVTRRTRRS